MKTFKISALMLAWVSVVAFSMSSCEKDDDPVKPPITPIVPGTDTTKVPTDTTKVPTDTTKVPISLGTVNLNMESVLGNQPLVLNVTQGTNANNETFKVTKFLYYVSNIQFTKTDGTVHAVPESYYLVNQADVASQNIALKDIPVGDYNKISYIVGVDSARNVAGAQTGALDPANAMFWSWNMGYIFLKLEGNSPQSTRAANAIVYHVGGFRAPNNAIRTVILNTPTGTNLLVRTDHQPEVHIKADVLKMFTGVTNTSFATSPGHAGGPGAVAIANNYASGMFSIERIN